jgi:hypothetical protein
MNSPEDCKANLPFASSRHRSFCCMSLCLLGLMDEKKEEKQTAFLSLDMA